MILTENQLDEWVLCNARDAQGVIVELIWRLVAASCPAPLDRRFPLGDSIGQHGPDGILNVSLSFDPFIPEGRSFWEVGTGLKAGDKATSDYSGLVNTIPEEIRHQSSFVFVTPRSGRRDWEHTWKEDAQGRWLQDRLNRNEWADVRVIDGTKLVDWLHQFPAVELWLANKIIGVSPQEIDTPEQRWGLVRSIGHPPSLIPEVFLAGREEACLKLHEVFLGNSVQLKLNTRYPDQVVDFVCAYLASQNEELRADAIGRCLVVSTVEAWKTLTNHREKLFLIADFGLDLTGASGTKLIQMARRGGHAIIFGGTAGGIPDPTSASLHNPRSQEVKDALTQSGYGEERARSLAHKSSGNLGSLLRCLQNLSLMPEWAEGSVASELAVAMVLGSWVDECSADRAIVESLAGNPYGEWIESMRVAALASGTPLVYQYGDWKFSLRFEGWYTLGARIFDSQIERFRAIAKTVFSESDPQFDLPVEERYAAAMHGKVLLHSDQLRKGLADTLALLGSHPRALTSCTPGKVESAVYMIVREVLFGCDWVRWGSLGALLPLFAEASPSAFLESVEDATAKVPSPFETLFGQEGDGITGRTYISGLLWALETLAWDPIYLHRATLCLAELSAIDPGGRWSNRPVNSLRNIYLPWYPQTCAPFKKRYAVASTLMEEYPEIGWNLLLKLLPDTHSTSSGTRKPEWRETIPNEWSEAVSDTEYRNQVDRYSQMIIDQAIENPAKLPETVDLIERLPLDASNRLLNHLQTENFKNLDETFTVTIWNKLSSIASKHRQFIDTDWALPAERIDRISEVADSLSPTKPKLLHRALFSERAFDLYDETESYEERDKKLQIRREKALIEIYAIGGHSDVIAFASAVQAPWRVGLSYGVVASQDIDVLTLPTLMSSSDSKLKSFVEGFVWGRYNSGSWNWVEKLDTSRWTAAEKAGFISFLPFTDKTWEYAESALGPEANLYWRTTPINLSNTLINIEYAIAKLIENRRPHAALRCISICNHRKISFNTSLAIEALAAGVNSDEPSNTIDSHQTVEIIKSLQKTPGENFEEIAHIEWAYMPLLDKYSNGSPLLLWQKLANEPSFFCELIRLVFRSNHELEAEQQTSINEPRQRVATNAYRLLSDWQHLPGTNLEGGFDSHLFKTWIRSVKESCIESGHIEVASSMIGQCLTHSPKDPDGLWIHRSVADVLNAKDSSEMRNGYRIALFNQRGAHWVDPTGAGERSLAARYRTQADTVEEAGYHRIASSLREMAQSYERDAELVVARNIKRDF